MPACQFLGGGGTLLFGQEMLLFLEFARWQGDQRASSPVSGGWLLLAGRCLVCPMADEREALRDWQRLFGLLRTTFFSGSPFAVEVERDLTVQQRRLDWSSCAEAGGGQVGLVAWRDCSRIKL